MFARESIDTVDLGAGAKQVQEPLLPALDVKVPGSSRNRVGAGATKQRVVAAQSGENLDQRLFCR
jgi:hypothetical protein